MRRPSVHEQEDGIIMAICSTGTSGRDSLLSWIRLLEQTNPRISKLPIIFTLKAPSGVENLITTHDPPENAQIKIND